jgi:hypothetical protein
MLWPSGIAAKPNSLNHYSQSALSYHCGCAAPSVSPHGFVEKIITFQKSAGQLSFRFCAALCLSFSLLSLGPFWDIIDCFD